MLKEQGSWHVVGSSIRQLRKANGLSLKQLAIGCDLSPNAISLVERGQVAPTIITVCKIAHALGVSASSLFREFCPGEAELVREGEPCVVSNPQTPALEMQLVNPTKRWQTRHRCESPNLRHIIYCISGSTLCEVDERSFLLRPGDRLFCSENSLHQFSSQGEETCVLIVVIPPRSQLGDHP